MSASTIKITFTDDLPIGAQLGFDAISYGLVVPNSMTFVFDWVTLRSSNNQVTTGTPTLNLGERAAINFVQAFNLDFGYFTVTRVVNEVTITAANIGIYTTEFYVNGIFAIYTNHPSIEFEVNNGSAVTFAVDSITYSEATNACTEVIATVTTNELTTKINSPVVVNPNTDNPFELTLLRGQSVSLIVENATGDVVNQTIQTPSLLSEPNFSLTINNSPNGATVIVTNVNTSGLDLEYSLDNTTWQTSEIFSGLVVDDYTLYVRDQLGCSFTKDFTIDEFGIYTPFFDISKANSFRFANRITWGDSANYKTDENTLSCEVDVPLPSLEIQKFQSADTPTTQFRSNFITNTAVVVKADSSEVNVPVVKKSNNIGLKDKRNARKYDLGCGKTGVYFLSGNIYDYNTNAIIEAYALNGLRPEWAIIGNYISIGSIWYLIEDVINDEDKNADVIVFNDSYAGPEVDVIVASIYNRFNYEVYEFVIDMVDYIDQKFRVRINCTDPKFTEIINLSEVIWCKVKHEKVLEIRYKNTTNAVDLMYSTGIEHLIRIPYISIKGKTEGDSEIHKTDTDVILLNADLYEADEIQFEPVTKEIWRKMMIALTHEKILINGVGYVRTGDFNYEGPLGDTNDYVLTATLLKTGSVYNSQTSGNLDFNGSEVAVPGLISTESGFVSY